MNLAQFAFPIVHDLTRKGARAWGTKSYMPRSPVKGWPCRSRCGAVGTHPVPAAEMEILAKRALAGAEWQAAPTQSRARAKAVEAAKLKTTNKAGRCLILIEKRLS